jgi:hypothetical protein
MERQMKRKPRPAAVAAIKQYRVDTLSYNRGNWEQAHQTNSLAVAKHYAASLYQSARVQAVRVVDQITQQVMSNSSDLSGWPFVETD